MYLGAKVSEYFTKRRVLPCGTKFWEFVGRVIYYEHGLEFYCLRATQGKNDGEFTARATQKGCNSYHKAWRFSRID